MRTSLRAAGVAAAACALAGAALLGTGAASAGPATAKTTAEPQNLAKLVEQIDSYYGGKKNADGTWSASSDSAYAHDVARIEATAKRHIARAAAKDLKHGMKPAIVLDVDDTTLLSYDYEKATNFTYSTATWNDYVNKESRVAVYGIPELVSYAHDKGVEVFFLTGMDASLREPAAANLKKVGIDVPLDDEHLILKDKVNPPSYLDSCAKPTWTCTTVQYKGGTRAHIESEGYDLIANFGDQQSDLDGGYADRTYKLPNPMYFVG
ncbi:HAD family acid phosphatase [Streptomyces sp. NPDC002004]